MSPTDSTNQLNDPMIPVPIPEQVAAKVSKAMRHCLTLRTSMAQADLISNRAEGNSWRSARSKAGMVKA